MNRLSAAARRDPARARHDTRARADWTWPQGCAPIPRVMTPEDATKALSEVELVPCAEMVRFANTGSEAVHLALRIARARR